MSVNSILSTGVLGVQYGMDRMNQAAGKIARAGDGGDLATPMVDLKISEFQVKASANVIKTGDQVLGTLIDIMA